MSTQEKPVQRSSKPSKMFSANPCPSVLAIQKSDMGNLKIHLAVALRGSPEGRQEPRKFSFGLHISKFFCDTCNTNFPENGHRYVGGRRHLDVLSKDKVGQAEVGSGAIRQVDHQQPIQLLAPLIEHHDVCETPVAGILDNLLERKPLQTVQHHGTSHAVQEVAILR